MSADIEIVLPSHGSLDVIKRGGYTKQLIQANYDYLSLMLKDVNQPEFMSKGAYQYIGQALESGTLNWWEAYAEVHELNKAALLRL